MAALREARNLCSQANHLRLLRVHPVALGDTSVNLKCVLEVFLAMRSSNQVAVVRSRIPDLSEVTGYAISFQSQRTRSMLRYGKFRCYFARNELGIGGRGA